MASCYRLGSLGLSVKSLDCDGSNVCRKIGLLPASGLGTGLPRLVEAFNALASNGQTWVSIDTLTCADHRLAVTRKGSRTCMQCVVRHIGFSSSPFLGGWHDLASRDAYSMNTHSAYPGEQASCDNMKVKTSSVILKEDFGTIPFKIRSHGRKLNIECAQSTYVHNHAGHDAGHQTDTMTSSCAFPLASSVNLTSFEEDDLAALTARGLFYDSSNQWSQTLHDLLEAKGACIVVLLVHMICTPAHPR